MSDLISRRALLKKLESMTNDNSEYIRNNSHQFTYKELAYIICNQPTAYDIEKVEEQLDEYITKIVGRKSALYQTIMRIVRKGGAE